MTTNTNMPSKVSILVIGVTDLRKSVDFYTSTLGLPLINQSEAIATVSASSINLLLSETLGKAIKPTTGSMEVVFPVDSVSAAHDALTGKGCTFRKTPREVFPGAWTATFTDPDGHLLTVFGGK